MGDRESQGIESAMSATGADLLRLEAVKYSSPDKYVDVLNSRFRHSSVYRLMQGAALLIEPEDRTTGVDIEISKAKAFLAGSLIGARIVHEYMPADIKHKIFEIEIGHIDEDLEDTEHGLHLQAVEIVDCSDRGYAMAEAYHDLLEEWEDILCPVVVDQSFYRRGFGFMVYLMKEAVRLQEEELLEQQLRDGINWDSVAAGWMAEFSGQEDGES